MAIINEDVDDAITWLQKGEVVGIPTETVYGLAGNALDPNAVTKIFKIKNRPHFDPLIVHIHNYSQLDQFVTGIPENASLLAEAFWPGPLTILLPKRNLIPDIVTSGMPNVAIRIPDHALLLSLLNKIDFPLAAPSANPFGYISPTNAHHVERQLGKKIPFILDGGPCKIGIESTIVGFADGKVIVHRLGGISVSKLSKVIKVQDIQTQIKVNPKTPGSMESHYAPTKPLFLGNIDELLKKYSQHKLAVLSFKDRYADIPPVNQFILSTRGNIDEAAKNLFEGLRKLDQLNIDMIIGELVPNKGLGLAINDRLTRASKK